MASCCGSSNGPGATRMCTCVLRTRSRRPSRRTSWRRRFGGCASMPALSSCPLTDSRSRRSKCTSRRLWSVVPCLSDNEGAGARTKDQGPKTDVRANLRHNSWLLVCDLNRSPSIGGMHGQEEGKQENIGVRFDRGRRWSHVRQGRGHGGRRDRDRRARDRDAAEGREDVAGRGRGHESNAVTRDQKDYANGEKGRGRNVGRAPRDGGRDEWPARRAQACEKAGCPEDVGTQGRRTKDDRAEEHRAQDHGPSRQVAHAAGTNGARLSSARKSALMQSTDSHPASSSTRAAFCSKGRSCSR